MGGGGIRSIFCVCSRGFLLLHSPMEPTTGWGVINNTDISFTQCEMSLLQKGLKYNLHTKRENWIQNLTLEAETAIQKLPTSAM
jgi:hypothetical protein